MAFDHIKPNFMKNVCNKWSTLSTQLLTQGSASNFRHPPCTGPFWAHMHPRTHFLRALDKSDTKSRITYYRSDCCSTWFQIKQKNLTTVAHELSRGCAQIFLSNTSPSTAIPISADTAISSTTAGEIGKRK